MTMGKHDGKVREMPCPTCGGSGWLGGGTARLGQDVPPLRWLGHCSDLGRTMSKQGDRARAADKEHRKLTSQMKEVQGRGNKPDDRLLRDRGEAATRRADHTAAAKAAREDGRK